MLLVILNELREKMDLEVVDIDDIKVVARTIKTNNKNESDIGTAKIIPLWMKAFEDAFCTGEQVSYGIYHNYESDHSGDYDFSVAVESSVEDSENMQIEPGRYLKFSFAGEMPQVVINGWHTIWKYFEQSQDYIRKYGTDFEQYIPGNQGVEIFISIY